MTQIEKKLRAFLSKHANIALVEVDAAKGSTPRDKGAWMLVSRNDIFGTIGGGQLEYMAIDKAREMLGTGLPSPLSGGSTTGRGERQNISPALLSIPLGPEIGQCCGGRVELSVRLVKPAMRDEFMRQATAEDTARPHVYVFGGGHVGHALADALSLLPVHTIVVETRADELKNLPEEVEARLTSVPEEAVREAPAASAFLVLTHDHALDFLIVAEALKRTDAAYVGMIGSKTKKATFRSWFFKNAGGNEEAFARLVSPIGGDGVKDKRPAVIAALAVAEIMTAVAHYSVGHARRAAPSR